MRGWHLLARIKCSVEKSVDQSRFAETRLADNHSSEVETLAHTLSVNLVRKVGEADVARQLLAASSERSDRGWLRLGSPLVLVRGRRIAVHAD